MSDAVTFKRFVLVQQFLARPQMSVRAEPRVLMKSALLDVDALTAEDLARLKRLHGDSGVTEDDREWFTKYILGCHDSNLENDRAAVVFPPPSYTGPCCIYDVIQIRGLDTFL